MQDLLTVEISLLQLPEEHYPEIALIININTSHPYKKRCFFAIQFAFKKVFWKERQFLPKSHQH